MPLDLNDEDQRMLYEYLTRQSVDPNAPQHDLLSQFPQLSQAPVTPAGDFDLASQAPAMPETPETPAMPAMDEGPGPNEEEPAAPMALPPTPAPAPTQAPGQMTSLPANMNEVVGPKYTDDARAQLYKQLQSRSVGAILGTALSGFGDAVANSYGTGGAHHQADTQSVIEGKRKDALQEFERGRTEQIQNFDQNVKLSQAQRDAQKYKNDQAQVALNRDPGSEVSQAKRQLLAKYTGRPVESLQGITGEQIDKLLPVAEKSYGVDSKNKLISAVRDQRVNDNESRQQDRLETQARNAVQSMRGDKSLQNTEVQRDAAITAYNRINEVQKQGKALNPIDYVDILGQLYKARTGSAPTNEVLKEAYQQTAAGKLAKVYTYFTGNQAPATTEAIMGSLKEMAAHMGKQADELHEGYMKTHLIKPSGLSDERWQPIYTTTRGRSFADSTGYQPGAQAGNFPPDVLRYAQTHNITPEQALAIKQQRGGQ
jgi:hypothetical protein